MSLDLTPLEQFSGDVPILIGFQFQGDAVERGLWEQVRGVTPDGKRVPASEAQRQQAKQVLSDTVYQLDNNPLISEFRIEANGKTLLSRPGRALSSTIRGPDGQADDASDQGPDDRVDHHGYLTRPVPVADVLELLRAHAADPSSVTWELERMFYTVDLFWDRLLMLMTDPNGTETVADASALRAQKALEMIRTQKVPNRKEVDQEPFRSRELIEVVDWIDLVFALFDKPLQVTQVKVAAPPQPGLPPMVQLMLRIVFDRATTFTGPDEATDDHKEMRSLIACEWSALARYARRLKEGDEERMTAAQRERWLRVTRNMAINIGYWLATHCDLRKGERILEQVVATHQAERDLAKLGAALREDLDRRLVIANHWGANDEDLFSETHQRVLSDLLGGLYHKLAIVSPVLILRLVVATDLNLSHRDHSLLALQCGVGHCQEHANISFYALHALKQGGTPMRAIVCSGLANRDHAFVIYDLEIGTVGPPGGVWITRTTTAGRTDPDQRNQITELAGNDQKNLLVWNLDAAILDSKFADPEREVHGFVLDPYLALDAVNLTGRTAEELLARIFPRDASGQPATPHATPWVWLTVADGQPIFEMTATIPIRNAVAPALNGRPNPNLMPDADRANFFPNL